MNFNVAADEYLYCNMVPRKQDLDSVKSHIGNLINSYEHSRRVCLSIYEWPVQFKYADPSELISIDNILWHLNSKLKTLKELENNGSI